MKCRKMTPIVFAAIAAMICMRLTSICTEAKIGAIYRNNQGKVYISKTGWVRIGGDTYYSHRTRSEKYDRNEVCRNEYRWRGNKLYYFGNDGKRIKKSTKYIKLNRDHSVRYVYTPGTNRKERWSAKYLRYQHRNEEGTWADAGNQTVLWWCCDWQE